MSDAVVAFVVWPVVTVIDYFQFILGSLIALVPFLVQICVKGPKFMQKFDSLYAFLSKFPFGNAVFSGIACFFAPYTASISARVEDFDRDKCIITLRDQPWLRNPFGSVHAIALSNLGEFTSGLLVMAQLQHNSSCRGIPVRIDTVYHTKARGTITAKCIFDKNAAIIDTARLERIDKYDVIVTAQMYDSKDVLVAETNVTWTISKKAPRNGDKKKA
jgi:acyl-coenzyme A thioesterase PaaI-like protein